MTVYTPDISILSERVVFAFSGKSAPNRFMKAAMTERLCTYSEDDELMRGEPTEELERVYEIWGGGGLGVFHTGNIMVHRAHLEAKGCAILDHDISKSYVSAFARLRHAATSQSLTPPIVIGQLVYMCGSAAAGGMHPLIAAGNEPQRYADSLTRWTQESIRNIAERFAFAARILNDAGFDGVQIHGAYGNILSRFLSCHSNDRTDKYGGSLENRSRFLLEIITTIQEAVDDPSFIIGVKLNAKDFLDGGLPAQEPQELARKLESTKVDYIELSGGTLEDLSHEQKGNLRQEHFLRFADKIRAPLTKTKIAVTGGFKTAESMIDAVRLRAADFVGLARSLAHEPTLAADILAGRTSRAKSNRLPTSLAINLEAGISQIQRMGKGLELRNFGDQQVADEWLRENSNELIHAL